MLHTKFDQDWLTGSEMNKFDSVDDDGRTDNEPLVYYKLTLWSFGSGELKSQNIASNL